MDPQTQPQNNNTPQQPNQPPQNGYPYQQQPYQQPQNGYPYQQQPYQQPQNGYPYQQQPYQQPQNGYPYQQQPYQQPQNGYPYQQQPYQQPYFPPAQPPKQGAGRVANFFFSLLPMLSFFAIQIFATFVMIFLMIFIALCRTDGNMQAVMQDYESIVYRSVPTATALSHLLAAIVFAFWYRFSFRKPRPAMRETTQKLKPEPILMALGLGILMSVFSSGTSGIESLLFPQMVEDTYEMMERSGIGTNGLVIFATVCLAPIGEELVFRGLTMKYAEKAFGRFWAANLLQAFLFGVIHMNWVQGVYAFFGGLVLGWVAHRYRSVVFSMLMHFAVNSFSTFGGDYLLGWIPLNFITATLLVVIPAAIAIGLIAWRNDAAEKAAPSGGTLPPQGQC
ncbi:CPBP family intramembrane glutamic endopeptidase [Ruminococcus sp.]